MKMTRHEIRERAFQTLFVLESNPDAEITEIYAQILATNNDQLVIPEYLDTLVHGVLDHKEELDGQIQASLADKWKLSRIAKTDLIILRLALFEIEQINDVPNAVVVNEALELAHTYSDDKSASFINGVLGKYA